MKKLKGVLLLVMLVITMICLSACGKEKKEERKKEADVGLVINSDNSFVVTYSEDFKEDYYDKSELEEMVDKEIADFNSTMAVDPTKGISKESLEVSKKTATLKIKFSNYQDYIKYSAEYVSSNRNARIFIGTYSEAVAAGYKLTGKFMKTDDSGELQVSEIETMTDSLVFYSNEGFNIKVDGEVVAIGSNTTYNDGIVKTSDRRENYFIYKSKS